MKKLLPFSFDYVILQTLNQGPTTQDKLVDACLSFFKDTMDEDSIKSSGIASIRKLTSIGAIQIKKNDANVINSITIRPSGLTFVTDAYKMIAREFHVLENRGKVE